MYPVATSAHINGVSFYGPTMWNSLSSALSDNCLINEHVQTEVKDIFSKDSDERQPAAPWRFVWFQHNLYTHSLTYLLTVLIVSLNWVRAQWQARREPQCGPVKILTARIWNQTHEHDTFTHPRNSQICWKIVAQWLTADVRSPIQMISFAVEHIAEIFYERWRHWRGTRNVVGARENFPLPPLDGPELKRGKYKKQ